MKFEKILTLSFRATTIQWMYQISTYYYRWFLTWNRQKMTAQRNFSFLFFAKTLNFHTKIRDSLIYYFHTHLLMIRIRTTIVNLFI